MIYRRTRPSDRIDVRKMCEEAGLHFDEREPLIGFVAEDQRNGSDSRLVGFSYVHQAAIIDPFLVKDNPVAAMKLFYQTDGAINMIPNCGSIVVQVSHSNKKLLDELPRIGFTRIGAEYVIFKKV